MARVKSALYFGSIRHRRYTPVRREFSHSVCYFYIDLSEVRDRFAIPGLFSFRVPSLFGFRRRAYLGGKEPLERNLSLDETVRRRVEKAHGVRPQGPIRMLTQIASFGISFNPVSFYYCFDPAGEIVEYIVAEITNTPWKERHAYVLKAEPRLTGANRFAFDKIFHVSPFLGMDYRYEWSFSNPESTLTIHMENHPRTGTPVEFDSTLMLRQKSWTPLGVLFALLRQPLMTLKTILLIYGHAAVIWSRNMPVFPHPRSEKK